ncbi:MAG: hypothetical protein JXJ17_05900 [Anaerolineae bacterium]|nr:hypothetical protein [Anaerolineae bacterium]
MATNDLGQLKDKSERLWYHIEMYRELAKRPRFESTEDKFIRNAIAESFAINVRALAAFFFLDPKGDDLLIKDFVRDEVEWRKDHDLNTLIKDYPALDDARERANKGVAHITYNLNRPKHLGKEYPVDDISNDLEKVIEAFLEHVVEDRLAECWDDELKKRNQHDRKPVRKS